ncbi:flavin reductase family protein [Paraoerskovia sediminicola]|uniref:flavin reductase family protein n=1 Tax=Paraoerskovia sediminicola TaxID=1138587 RepID=UPI00257428E4|nr:flavin reductase family protein [Paraoerskovia sediminicola]
MTTRGESGPVGLTTTAVMSVSMDPPLIGVAVGRTSRSLPALLDASAFAVQVLRHDRAETAGVFASRSTDKFAGLDVDETERGTPVLTGDARYVVECEHWDTVEAGDHILLIGQVVGVTSGRRHEPRGLVYFERGFHQVGMPTEIP